MSIFENNCFNQIQVYKVQQYQIITHMGKKELQEVQPAQQPPKQAKRNKYNRFEEVCKVDEKNKSTWPSDAVVYIGHLPHGFYEDQLKAYFTQYGQVLAVKVSRSRKTARSKGYAFIQFKYAEVANIVAETMNGYMLMGKILVASALSANKKNPFAFATSKQFKFIDWKRMFMKEKNRVRTVEQTKKQVEGLLKGEQERKEKLKAAGINYDYNGFKSFIKK